MAAEALVVICPMWGTCLPPMGPAYIAAYLEKKGIPCDLLDLNITLYDAALPEEKSLWKMERLHMWTREDLFQTIRQTLGQEITYWSQYIVDKGYKTVGFSISGANILFSIEIAKILREKKPELCIVFGGPSCNYLHDDQRMPFRFFVSSVNGDVLLKDGVVDYFVLGEGEESFLEIVSAKRKGIPVNRPGVVPGETRDRALIQKPIFIQDLDSLPFPAWDKLPLEKYEDQNELPILFNRGCINRCAFCNDWSMWGGRFRSRSSKNIFEEMIFIQSRYKKRAFRCNDLVINGNLRQLDKLADLIIDSGVAVYWAGQGVIRIDMTAELLRKLKKAGMALIVYGVESLADNVLAKMKKPFTFDVISTVLRRTKEEAGIKVWINLIIGFPGETEEDFRITKDRLKEIRRYVDAVSSLNPCNITAATELEMFPESFGIVFPEAQDGCEYWLTADNKNTFETRKRKACEIYDFLQRLRIPTHFVGIYDGNSPSQEERRVTGRVAPPRKRLLVFILGRIVRVPILILLLIYHFFLATYLQLVKVLRKTIVFPGG